MVSQQYEVYWVDLDPTVGSEIQKTRPCVVVSPDAMNRHLRTLIIAPLTRTSKAYPSRVRVLIEQQEAWVVLDQLRSIDRQRLGHSMGFLKTKEVNQIKSVLHEMLIA
jgi:mRNA interferase MazF